MKKFALLGAVAALATAGGVFAAWEFTANGSSDVQDQKITIALDDTDINYVGYGSVGVVSDLELIVEPKETNTPNENKYTATLGGSVKLTYTPSIATKDAGVRVGLAFATVKSETPDGCDAYVQVALKDTATKSKD